MVEVADDRIVSGVVDQSADQQSQLVSVDSNRIIHDKRIMSSAEKPRFD